MLALKPGPSLWERERVLWCSAPIGSREPKMDSARMKLNPGARLTAGGEGEEGETVE